MRCRFPDVGSVRWFYWKLWDEHFERGAAPHVERRSDNGSSVPIASICGIRGHPAELPVVMRHHFSGTIDLPRLERQCPIDSRQLGVTNQNDTNHRFDHTSPRPSPIMTNRSFVDDWNSPLQHRRNFGGKPHQNTLFGTPPPRSLLAKGRMVGVFVLRSEESDAFDETNRFYR